MMPGHHKYHILLDPIVTGMFEHHQGISEWLLSLLLNGDMLQGKDYEFH